VKNIKAIVTDVDGVIVGNKHGINFPLPNASVINALRHIREKGTLVILCTAKFNHAVKEIIIQANLRNPHITDGGALIIDPLNNKLIKKHIFDKTLARNLVSKLIPKGFYTEVFGADEYYLQKDHISAFTEKRIKILQKEHKTVNAMLDSIDEIDVIKILAFTHTVQQKQAVNSLLEGFTKQINLVWSTHPALPTQNAVITMQGVSKRDATKEVLDYLHISPEDTLGIGDTLGDWNFMSLCRYVGTVGDESTELKELAKTKGEGNYYFGSSVDTNGFLEILHHFI